MTRYMLAGTMYADTEAEALLWLRLLAALSDSATFGLRAIDKDNVTERTTRIATARKGVVTTDAR